MSETNVVHLPHDEVLAAVRSIVEAFQAGDSRRVEEALHRLGTPLHDGLYQKLGTMTRSLHNSLEEFNASLNRDNLTMSTTNIPDATDKLEAVIQMTLNAANTTLTHTESNSQALTSVRDKLNAMKMLCASQGWNAVESRIALLNMLGQAEQDIATAEHSNHEILMAQTFQDLTGQAIRKVIKLVSRLEAQLVELVRLFGHQTEAAPAAPTAIPADPTATTLGKLGQEDADAVLKQFGF